MGPAIELVFRRKQARRYRRCLRKTVALVEIFGIDRAEQAAVEAVAVARSGDGPSLLECQTYRHYGHSKSDPATYRPKGELESWLERDPLIVTRARLVEAGVTDEQLDEAAERAKESMRRASEAALAAAASFPRLLEEARRAVSDRDVVLAARRLREACSQPGGGRRRERVTERGGAGLAGGAAADLGLGGPGRRRAADEVGLRLVPREELLPLHHGAAPLEDPGDRDVEALVALRRGAVVALHVLLLEPADARARALGRVDLVPLRAPEGDRDRGAGRGGGA